MSDHQGEVAISALTSAQIGRSGELLVQYRLLSRGIESSAMTTDAGIGLVAYAPAMARAITIQVKTNLRPKPAGGRGKPALDRWLRDDSPSELVALTELERDKVWLLWHDEFARMAQQKSSGRLHFCFYVAENHTLRNRRNAETDYRGFDLENRINEMFHRPRHVTVTKTEGT